MPSFANTDGLVIFEHTLSVAVADGAVLVFRACVGTGCSSVIFVALTLRCTTFEVALAMAATDLAARSRACVAARFPDEAILAVALPNTLRHGAQTTMTADLCILVGRARNRAVFPKPALLAHALHLALVWNAVAFAETWQLAGLLPRLAEWTRLLADATTESLVTCTLGAEAFLATDQQAFAFARARIVCCSAWALVLAAGALESLLAFALSDTIRQVAGALAPTGDTLVLGADSIAASAHEAWLALADCFFTLELASAVATASNLPFGLATARAVPVAAFADEPSSTFACRFVPFWGAFAVPIADVAIRVCWTFHVALVASVAFLAHTFGVLGLRIHEARSLA